MSCPSTLTGIEVSCKGNAGGIKRVIVAVRDFLNLPTPEDMTEGAGEDAEVYPSAIDASKITATQEGVQFVEYKFRPQTGSLTKTANVDAIQGTSSVTSVVTLQFSRMESTKRIAIQQAINTGSCVIVEDYNGTKWLLGYDMPVYASSAEGATGTAVTDTNMYTLELQDVSFEMPHEVRGDIDTLLAGVPKKA